MPMRANALPIGENPVFIIGADRCVEGPFGIGLADGSMVATVLANWSNIVTG